MLLLLMRSGEGVTRTRSTFCLTSIHVAEVGEGQAGGGRGRAQWPPNWHSDGCVPGNQTLASHQEPQSIGRRLCPQAGSTPHGSAGLSGPTRRSVLGPRANGTICESTHHRSPVALITKALPIVVRGDDATEPKSGTAPLPDRSGRRRLDADVFAEQVQPDSNLARCSSAMMALSWLA